MTGAAEIGKPMRLVARELARNPRRTTLTFLGLVISFFLFTSLESVLYTLERMVTQTARETILFTQPRDRVSFWQPTLPGNYVTRISETSGVLASTPLLFYFGRGRDEGSFAAAAGVDLDSYLAVRHVQGLTSDEIKAFRSARTGGLVGERLLEANGWKVGEEVTIRGRGRAPSLSFTVVGDIDGEDGYGGIAMVKLDYLQEVLGTQGRVTFIQSRVGDPLRAGAVTRSIDDHFANFRVPTESITEKAHVATFLGGLASALGAISVIGYLTLAVTVLVVGNSVAMSVRERTREIGTLRALGFGRGRVMGLVLGEAMFVALLGGFVGAIAAYVVFAAGWVKLPIDDFAFVTDAGLVARSALLSLPVGALAALQPAWSAVRMSITDALRYAD